MRILLFIDSLCPGGAQRQLVGLALLLKDAGHDVRVAVYHDIPFFKSQLDEKGITVFMKEDKGNWIQRVWNFREIIKDVKPYWVIAYLESPSIIASFWKMLGMDYHLLVSERNTNMSLSLKDQLRFWLFRFTNIIVSNSYSQKTFIDTHFPRYRNRSFVIPNFVDLKQFCPNSHRQRGHIIIVVASVWESKNTLGFIEAIKILKERKVKIIAKWYGLMNIITPYIRECFNRIAEYKLDDVVSLFPKTIAIASKYREADYFCLPSFYEGTPNAMCEAMACGLPIICSNVCDNNIYVKEGKNGFLFNPNDAYDMADKIEKALALSDVEYIRYKEISISIAKQEMSSERFIDNYLELLK